jgi:uncharacterized protein YecE (DUF72 family)
MKIAIGTAGWAIPPVHAEAFEAGNSSLERYATRFSSVEINSSFHRSHRASTWRRWADSVPDGFRFAVKMPKSITHKQKLVDCSALLKQFIEEVAPLGPKLGVILVQLPPSLNFQAELAADFFAEVQSLTPVPIACEPRHPGWFAGEADDMLAQERIARVAADPARMPAAAVPGGWRGLAYFRLHGSPRIYRSSYEEGQLRTYAQAIEGLDPATVECWCIFDNTASSAAAGNALSLLQMLSSAR